MMVAMLRFATIIRYIGKQQPKKGLETQHYNKLMAELRDTIYRMALSILGDRAEAEDILQDVSERVWRARDAVLKSQYPRAYVYRIARNMAIDRLRHRKHTLPSSALQLTDSGNDGDRESNLNDITLLTRKLIAALPEKQRLALELRDVEGYEIYEIAAIVESDETSVRMNLSRARKSIREQLIKALDHGVSRD